MKKSIFSIYMVFFLLSGLSLVFGIGEKTLSIGKSSGWRDLEVRHALTETAQLRPYPVLALSSANSDTGAVMQTTVFSSAEIPPDLYLSFDEGNPARFRDQCGNYDVSVTPDLGAASEFLARHGNGAARFSALAPAAYGNAREQGPLAIRPRPGALFSAGTAPGDFTIEFWLCPASPANGEQILNWSSTLASSEYSSQRIQCYISKNRLQWTFTNFFLDAAARIPGADRTFTLTGNSLLPGKYSHHLVRYNGGYGILEYLVDGRQEDIVYTTSSGREGGEIYTPLIGRDSCFVLGSRYTGLIDEFKIYPQYIEKPFLAKYPAEGGRAESRTLDLGSVQSSILRLDASGGRLIGDESRAEYAGAAATRYPDYSEMRFYLRSSNNPYQWNMPWIRVDTGAGLPDIFRGRYVQIAVEFFPSGDCETTPYLEEIRLVYRSIDSPWPPAQVTALAGDGSVDLYWRAVGDSNLGGYLVYIGVSSGEYYSEYFSSPVDAGTKTSIHIDGLENGTLYFFAVASYDKESGLPGEFSREIAARPLRDYLEKDYFAVK